MSACPLCEGTRILPYRRVARRYGRTHYELELAKCASCAFVFLRNNPHIEYDEDYLYHENVVTAGDPLKVFRAEERLASIMRVVPPGPARRFLDIGIGDGLLLSLAEGAGYTTFGLDINPAGVELARKQYHLRAQVRLEPVNQAFPGVKFDVIHMNEVIEHIEAPIPLLQSCREHLAGGGLLVIQTGDIDSVASRIKGEHWDYYRPVHVSYFSTRTLEYAVLQAGFRVIHRATVDWRWRPVLRAAAALRRRQGMVRALRFLFLYLTALPHGLRRSVIIHAI